MADFASLRISIGNSFVPSWRRGRREEGKAGGDGCRSAHNDAPLKKVGPTFASPRSVLRSCTMPQRRSCECNHHKERMQLSKAAAACGGQSLRGWAVGSLTAAVGRRTLGAPLADQAVRPRNRRRLRDQRPPEQLLLLSVLALLAAALRPRLRLQLQRAFQPLRRVLRLCLLVLVLALALALVLVLALVLAPSPRPRSRC
mmetsp:Transcript_84849/g.229930  ORF Transcript_84849/g.229930 Transcript_84849/m.229930 type:complete len:200 (+) Transcript_84849:215-814(+)